MLPEVFEEWRHIPISATTPLTDACRNATPIFLESPDDWRALYPDLLPVVEATLHRAQMVVPLISAGRSVGAMGLAFREPHCFSEDEREFVSSVAAQCAVALERARLFKAERDARAAAETANRAKTDFLAAMSHELRTPLTAIAGHLDLMALQLYGPINHEQRAALGRVKRAQQHLLGVIDDLLSFARVQHGKIEFHLAAVPVAEVVDDVTPMIQPQLAANKLQYDAKVDTRVQVRADRGKLAQILLNLLGNAVKFTPAGGSIQLRVNALASEALVDVTNSGPGIPADKIEAVFDPFVQLETSPSARQQGTGLGLAISRDLARGMGGEVTVASVPGVSTTFTLRLPTS
jgi:signal transduction histidine kinase